MAANYVFLEKITVGATAVSTVAFSGIPQTGYTDLLVKTSVRTTRAAQDDSLYVYFNTDTTAANYKLRLIYGTGSAVNSYNVSTYADQTIWTTGNGGTVSTFNNGEFYIPNYTSSTAKSAVYDSVGENNDTASHMGVTVSSWTGTAAINKITMGSANGQNIMPYSTFYLYGVAKLGTTPAIVPYATGGDTIMTDGTYWYHTFLSSGAFTPIKALTANYLVVAGGGGGGKGVNAGGGGAGGLRSTVTATGGGGSLESALSLTAQAYTVTVGAGGAGGVSDGLSGTDGSNSVFSTITSTGGGAGSGGNSATNGRAGGSGGGGGTYETLGGAGTANQGYAGGPNIGTAGTFVKFRAGGGGGAGAVGGGAAASLGNGGAGVAVSISGSSVTYAGGGGGGANDAATTGGAGGGGGAATSGTANTGGGGGGASVAVSNTSGSGGSGIVIVRYPV